MDPSNKECIADAVTGTKCNANVTIGIPTNDMLVPGVDLASVPKGYLGEPMFEHGFFAEIRGSQGAFGSKANFLQIHIELERVFKLAPKWHLLLRDEFGATAASHFGEMPPAMRFYAGGEGSVRGFEYDGLSPTQKYCLSASAICAEAQAGGKDVITGTVEFDRDLPRNFGLAFFFDYGNAFNHFGPQEQAVYNNEQQIVLTQGAAAAVRCRHRVSVPPAGADARHRHRTAAVAARQSPALHQLLARSCESAVTVDAPLSTARHRILPADRDRSAVCRALRRHLYTERVAIRREPSARSDTARSA